MPEEDKKKTIKPEEKENDKKIEVVQDTKEVKDEAIDEKKELEKLLSADAPPLEAPKKDAKKSTPKIKGKKKKVRRQVTKGNAYIQSSYNNTKVTFTDLHGNVLAWSTSGFLGFKGAKKATTYAATQVVASIHEKAQKYGLKDINVFVKGIGSGRDAAMRALAGRGYNLLRIKDITPIPHNGCRPKKARRV